MKAMRLQRRRASPSGPGITLFPFIAVLICTMGAMVPLLIVVSRAAQLQAETAAKAKLEKENQQLQIRHEDVRWRIEQLDQSRAKTEAQLAEARLELGHVEDHRRRLGEQLAQYEKVLGELEHAGDADQQRTARLQAELEQVRAQIQSAKERFDEAHRQNAEKNRSYAVVPYEGPNQTRRRPIYLECRADAVVLQPEGIELTESDFEGPLGPGNPLAAALRAAREYMLAQREFDPRAGEPYPLLLVRPEGINAYYAAREAIKSWGFEFGYELVDDDWRLAYPPSDTRLAEVIRQAVDSARISQAQLIAAAPRRHEIRPKVVYRASPQGGFVRETVPADDAEDYRPVTPTGPVGGTRGEGWGDGEEASEEGRGGREEGMGKRGEGRGKRG